jgi:hypothetical protein
MNDPRQESNPHQDLLAQVRGFVGLVSISTVIESYGRQLEEALPTMTAQDAEWVRDLLQPCVALQKGAPASQEQKLQHPSDVAFFAFVNHRASCFMDALLVALFVPMFDGFFDRNILEASVDASDGQETPWEVNYATCQWRASVQHALRQEVGLLRGAQSETSGWVCSNFRNWLRQCPFVSAEGVHVNFADGSQQSAVDLFRYMLAVCFVRDDVVRFQRSTTLMQRRMETLAAGGDLAQLTGIWRAHNSTTQIWDHRNAHTLPDESERTTILNDATHQSVQLQNAHGDVRKIGPPETTAIFLCQMTLEDQRVGLVPIERELVPHVEVVDSEGYTGSVQSKINAIRIIAAPVLAIEVSRKVQSYAPGVAPMNVKISVPVSYGYLQDDDWVLQVHGILFALRSVVCHIGTSDGGHYVAFVQEQDADGGKQWFFYDDFGTGRLVPISPAELEHHVACPSKFGELFFYSPHSQ